MQVGCFDRSLNRQSHCQFPKHFVPQHIPHETADKFFQVKKDAVENAQNTALFKLPVFDRSEKIATVTGTGTPPWEKTKDHGKHTPRNRQSVSPIHTSLSPCSEVLVPCNVTEFASHTLSLTPRHLHTHTHTSQLLCPAKTEAWFGWIATGFCCVLGSRLDWVPSSKCFQCQTHLQLDFSTIHLKINTQLKKMSRTTKCENADLCRNFFSMISENGWKMRFPKILEQEHQPVQAPTRCCHRDPALMICPSTYPRRPSAPSRLVCAVSVAHRPRVGTARSSGLQVRSKPVLHPPQTRILKPSGTTGSPLGLVGEAVTNLARCPPVRRGTPRRG